MARKVSDNERIITFFMQADLGVAKTALEMASSIVKNRAASTPVLGIGGTSVEGLATTSRRGRKAKAAGAPQTDSGTAGAASVVDGGAIPAPVDHESLLAAV